MAPEFTTSDRRVHSRSRYHLGGAGRHGRREQGEGAATVPDMNDGRRSALHALRFWVLARPVFRSVDWYASYTAAGGARRRRTDWRDHGERLAELDRRRRSLQSELATLAATHGSACAACKGGCCRDERFRDSIVDRVLQNQSQPNPEPRSLRSKTRERWTDYPPLRTPAATLEASADYCPHCTPQGCALAPEDRPTQCLAYMCRASITPLSTDECRRGIRALKDLMRVMIETAHLPRGAARPPKDATRTVKDAARLP